VLSIHGSVAVKGAGFVIQLDAIETNGTAAYTRTLEAPALAQVVPTVSGWVQGLRTAVGDTAPPPTEPALSPSLEADHEFALGLDLHDAGDDAEAVEHFKRALDRDQSFALAAYDLAVSYFNVSRQQDAEEAFATALRMADHLGERDRLSFYGTYYNVVTGEIDRAIEAFAELTNLWPQDLSAMINLAASYAGRQDFAKATEAGRRAALAHPRSIHARANLIDYALKAGDIAEAVKEGRQLIGEFSRPPPYVYGNVALAEALAGNLVEAKAAYAKSAAGDPSQGVIWIADFDLSRGHVAGVEVSLERGIADDRAHDLVDNAEVKQVLLAELRLRRGDKSGALQLASTVARDPSHVFMAALIQLVAGDDKRARASAAKLAEHRALAPRTYAKLIAAEDQRLGGSPDRAIATAREALQILDIWWGHEILARALLDAKRFSDADAELELCFTRRGQAALMFDDYAGVHYIPALLYYRARAKDGLGDAAAAKALYEQFIAAQPEAEKDPMIEDARRRLSK
jgi:Tfp pilus assembly protein PilF